MVPNGWEIKNLEELVSKTRKITYGIVVPGPNTPNGNLMIRAQDYSFGWKSVDSIYRVSDKIHESYKRSQVVEGDVLLTIVGSIGKTAIVPKHLSGANLTQQTARLSFSENDGGYFHAVLNSPIGKKEIYRYAKSGVQPSLNLSDISKFKIPVPPLPEQQKIATILGTWDKAISTTERLIDNSKQQKKALMQQLLTGKKRLLDESDKPFESEWEEVRLDQAAGKIYGGGTPSRSNPEYWNGKIPWVTVKDLISTNISDSQEYITPKGVDESSTNLVPAGTVIISTRMALGKAVICTQDVAINQDLKAISSSNKIISIFLHYWFLFQANNIERMGTGSTVKGIQIGLIKGMLIKLPLVTEQQKISSVLSNADKEIELLQQQLTDLKQEKKALMQQLLTGKRRVKIDDKEVA